MPNYHVKLPFEGNKPGDIIPMRKTKGAGYAAAGLVEELKEPVAPKKAEAKVEAKKDTKA